MVAVTLALASLAGVVTRTELRSRFGRNLRVQGEDQIFAEVLPKPLSADTLAQAIRRILAKHGGDALTP